VTVHVIRRTGHSLDSCAAVVVVPVTVAIASASPIVVITAAVTTPTSVVRNDFEISATAAIYPNPVAISSPAVAFLAARITSLLNHANVSVVRVHRTIVTTAIFRRTIYNLLCGEGRCPAE